MCYQNISALIKWQNNWSSMINSGSTGTIIGYDELQKILKHDVVFVRLPPKEEKYVDFNKRPPSLMEYIFCEQIHQKRKDTGGTKRCWVDCWRDWFNYLQYKLVQKNLLGATQFLLNRIAVISWVTTPRRSFQN